MSGDAHTDSQQRSQPPLFRHTLRPQDPPDAVSRTCDWLLGGRRNSRPAPGCVLLLHSHPYRSGPYGIESGLRNPERQRLRGAFTLNEVFFWFGGIRRWMAHGIGKIKNDVGSGGRMRGK